MRTNLTLALLVTLSACSLAGQGQFTVTDPEAPRTTILPLSRPEIDPPADTDAVEDTVVDTVEVVDTTEVEDTTVVPEDTAAVLDTGSADVPDTADTTPAVDTTVADTIDTTPTDTVQVEVLDTTEPVEATDTGTAPIDTIDTTPAPPEPRLCVTPTMTWDAAEVVISIEGDTSAGWLEVHLPGGLDFMLVVRSGGAPQHINRWDLQGLDPTDVGFIYYSSALGEAIGWGPEILPGAAVRIVPLDQPTCFF